MKAFNNLVSHIYFDIRGANTEEKNVDGKRFYVTKPSNNQVYFRNFLTYSTSESFDQENFVDNGFHVTKVLSLEKNDFEQEDIEGKLTSEYYANTRFYISNLKKSDLLY